MPTEIYLVKVGMTMTEGMVAQWYIEDGEKVDKGEMLYALETEKVNMDVDAETTGTVKHLVEAGVNLKPGDLVGYIYAEDEEIPADPGGSVSGNNKEVVAKSGSSEGAFQPDLSEKTPKDSHQVPSVFNRRILSSPAARKRAAALGVDIARVQGTGPGGRITSEDVESFAENPDAGRTQMTSLAADEIPGREVNSSQLIPHTGMRRTIAKRMYESLQNTAQLTMDMTVLMEEAVKMRDQLVEEWRSEDLRPTFTDLVLAATARALKRHPLMNSRFTEEGIFTLSEINLGVAVALPEGLVVPVIRRAADLSFKVMSKMVSELTEAAKRGELGLDDFAGGTFTVSSLGMYGVDAFTPILNEPQSGILGVNRIYDGTFWRGEKPRRVKQMTLSLTWDHRVLDGAPAAEFLGEVKSLLEQPYRLLV
ncbi:MAG: 2-oxo acid dehydrogenase subunit E2 [Gammaproteobacteria bacterium]|nr:2-oxo acid dehydrogenase subunit E2 [Gammaproteobacteria bacterium]